MEAGSHSDVREAGSQSDVREAGSQSDVGKAESQSDVGEAGSQSDMFSLMFVFRSCGGGAAEHSAGCGLSGARLCS